MCNIKATDCFYRVCLVWLPILLVATHLSADERAEQVLSQAVPRGVDDLRVMESVVTKIAKQVLPATVGVRLGGAEASGVVVTEDGYVLTASHVAGRPGRSVQIVFQDGRVARGKTLGMNPDVDGALIKIADKGPWEHAPLAPEDAQPQAGDWCLAAGHPGGILPTRTPPLRFGRVIVANDFVIRTDCTISPGDSGGPLFDLQGRVIGVHSRISEDETDNLHVPAISFVKTWDKLKAGESTHLAPTSHFLAQFDFNDDGKLELREMPRGMYRRVYERLAKEFNFDVDKAQPIEELRKKLGVKVPDAGPLIPEPDGFYTGKIRQDDLLLASKFTRGATVKRAFSSLAKEYRNSVVEVVVGNRRVALGTIVAEDGWIVTKASELKETPDDKIRLRFANGKTLTPEKIHEDPTLDLAWLRVKFKVPAVKFSSANEVTLGQWLVSLGRGSGAASVGVASVQARKIPRTSGFMGVGGDGVDGGAVVRTIMKGSGADESSLRINDVILQVMESKVRTFEDLAKVVRTYRPGDKITLRVKRDDQALEVVIKLGVHPETSGMMEGSLSGPTSDRMNDFEIAIQHDSIIQPGDCGGPLLNLEGECVGVNIARSERTASYAIPASEIRKRLEKLKEADQPEADQPEAEQPEDEQP